MLLAGALFFVSLNMYWLNIPIVSIGLEARVIDIVSGVISFFIILKAIFELLVT